MTNKTPSSDTKLAVIATDISYIKERINVIEHKMEQDFLTRSEFTVRFEPIQKIVYGIVSLVLLSVFGALIALVLVKP